MILRFFCSVLLFLTTMAAGRASDSWASFQNGGQIARPGADPIRLSEVRWTSVLPGYGQSAPVVHNDLAYLTTVEGEKKDHCHVIAVSLDDGRQVWQRTVENASPRTSSRMISRAAPTPAADEHGVVCFFEGGNVVALTHSGDVRWERNLVEDYGAAEARHGLSASVEQDEDSVFVWVERSADPYVVSLAKESGATEWKVAGVGATSWASPRLVPVKDKSHLVLSASGHLTGLDPDTGAQLWSFEGLSGNTSPTPMPLGDGRFLIGATVGRGESGGGRAAQSNGVIQIRQAENGTWSAAYIWQADRATSSFGSPVVHNGMAYFVNRQGVLYGLNAEDGQEVFVKRLKGSNWATPIAVGSQVFFFGRDGKVDSLSTAEADPQISTWDGLPAAKSVGSEQPEAGSRRRRGMASGPVLYAAAWCGDSFLLRRGDRLFAVEISK